ncbi:MAG TPA: DUF3300 domain-containing protein, partial [Acetobacteraceae bacterium]|nr:DUF3300 domain-containing protein [Acetobacteraceae bacterium]
MPKEQDISRYPGWYRTLATCIAISFGVIEVVDVPTRYALAQALPGTPPAAPAQPAPDAKLTQPELEQLLAPVALYPDNLLALVLMASTYPLEIVQAQRWLARPGNDKLKGAGLEQALQAQSWDPSVKSLVAFPLALKTMADQLEWTQKLGDAVLAQQQDVLNAVQALRARAQAAGKLESGSQQKVSVTPNTAVSTPPSAPGTDGGSVATAPASVTTQADYVVPPPQQIISIEPTQPDQVYVPAYNPNVVYGSWPYPSNPPPYYPPPPYYGVGSALLTGMAFAGGVALIGSACCWANTGWNNGSLYVNNSRVTNIDRTGVANGNWQHRAEHRQGVGYQNQEVRNRFEGNRTERQASREQFRGRTGEGGSGLGNRGDAGGNRLGNANAGGGANRPGGASLGAGANRQGRGTAAAGANRLGGGNVAGNRPGGGNRAATRPANAGAGRGGGVSQARNGRPNVGGAG